MDTAPDPRPDLTAAQRIAIALGTASDPRGETPDSPPGAVGPTVAEDGSVPEPAVGPPA